MEVSCSFADYKKMYYYRNNLCGKLGYIYDSEYNILNDINCMKWDCVKCRSILKFILYKQIISNVYTFNLNQHFVITCPGTEFRNKYTWIESYYIMSKNWNILLNRIRRKYPDFTFILLPRSQKDGYCHYHIICTFLKVFWLSNQIHKCGMGYFTFKSNQNVADYLCQEFFKDHEYIIPPNIHHYRSSRNIIMKNYKKDLYRFSKFDYRYRLDVLQKYIKSIYGYSFCKDDYIEKSVNDFLLKI